MHSKQVLVLLTGGTIAMVSGEEEILLPASQANQFLAQIRGLDELASVDLRVLCNLDSSDIQPEHWQMMAETISAEHYQYDGFVIVHGTDTMVMSASALSYALQSLGKPIILTGAQLPVQGQRLSDGLMNLAHAVEAATLDIAEVCIMFGTQLLRGNRTYKQSTFYFNAFHTIDRLPIAEVGTHVEFVSPRQPRRATVPQLNAHFDSSVHWQILTPGLDPQRLSQIVNSGISALFLQGYGSGNVPVVHRSLIPCIEQAVQSSIPVVISSICRDARIESAYEGGRAVIQAGAIPAHQMTAEAAFTKLMWAAAQVRDVETVREIMQTNLAYEMGCESLITV